MICICVGTPGYKDQFPLKTSAENVNYTKIPYVSSCYDVVTSLSAFSSLVALNQITQLHEIKPRDKMWKYTEKNIVKDLQEVFWPVHNTAKHKEEELCLCLVCQTT